MLTPRLQKVISKNGNNDKNLVVVSYRLPFVLEKNKETGELVRKASAGGLVTAVAPVVARSNGKWVGWPGHEYNEGITIPESSPSDKNPTADLKSNQIVPVKIEKVLRDILNESPDANPLIWIHDYQLMLAACTIREVCEIEKLRCKLAFFLHIPFPPWDLVNIFPWADSILQGMMSCDLIGFHTEDYVLNFMDCIQRGLGCRIDKSELLAEHYNRTVSILPLPIGIPFKIFNDLAKEAPPNKMDNDARIILGVDRLDYTKGLANRLLAFDRLLEKFPEYVDLLDKLVGQINGKYSTTTWSPIRYIYGSVSQIELAGYYRDAEVGLITPLRDGMNLVAKEFVACRVDKPGVLILSPFAGAGKYMHEALTANPYEIGQLANVIDRALSMPIEDREVRMAALRNPTQILAVIPPETKAILERLSHRKDVFYCHYIRKKCITYAALQDEVCSEGAWVENKGVLLTFHYRETPVELREKMVTNARKLIASHGFKVGESHCALEGKPKVQWNKGRAALHILRVTFGVNWTENARIIFAGDDVTDEDAIVALKGLSKTFRIVSHNMTATNADIRLPSQDSVVTLLRYIERHITSRDSQ
ncbi:TPS [Lepeophtheirus salmonis]|uniref:TPS n=1 Tax=Lepeophtheirus salmonis TaxID=72036 RepID=A0A7R8CLD1_LEPSM|nr:TPS [Lepeophtheirus salmonis]CAF2857995.1 TPS [Lepeophtheirus salmonis]